MTKDFSEKNISTRAKLLKKKRQEEARRREEANQKKITEWLKWSAQREEDRKTERAQLLAMKKRKEESRLSPALLSPVYRISFAPSPAARKILGQDPASPALILPSPSDPRDDPLPFPTLVSSLKEEVLKDASRKLFQQAEPLQVSAGAAPKSKEGLVPKKSQELSKEDIASKPNPSQNVLSGICPEQGGSAADLWGDGLPPKEKKCDGSL